MRSAVALLRTRPETVVEDYGRLMRLVKYDEVLRRDQDLILKLNLSWTKYFPACSSQPWQVDGVLTALGEDGYDRRRIFPVENKTVVTNPIAGCRNNKWRPVLERHGVPFIPLPDVEWTVYKFESPLLKLNAIFPEGIEIPKMYVGKNVLHLPTVKCVHPDTEILLADGSLVRAEVLVKEMHVREPASDLPDGDRMIDGEARVVSLGPNGLATGLTTHLWRTPLGDRTVWTVNTRSGRTVTTSRAHPFLTPEGWVKAEALRTGDRIAVARRVTLRGRSQRLPMMPKARHQGGPERRAESRFGVGTARGILRSYSAGESITTIASKLRCRRDRIRSLLRQHNIGIRGNRVWARAPETTSPEFWRWLGYFVAEGYASETHGSVKVSIANADAAVRSDYVNLSRTLFGVEPTVRGIEIFFHATSLGPFLECLGFVLPTRASTKTVPEMLFRCPNREIAAFLQAYFDGDGTVRPDGVHATTKSERLARQAQMLLTRLGVFSFVRPVWSRLGSDRSRPKQRYFKLSVYGADVVTMAKWIKFRCSHKKRGLRCLVGRRNRGGYPTQWDTVPVPRALFRMIREGLGVTHKSSGNPGGVSNIEIRCTEPTRRVLRHFIRRFAKLDVNSRFLNEIDYMRLLASEDIAWDRVQSIDCQEAEVPFLYDLSVRDGHSFVGNGIVLHNTHGHSTTTGAIKNAFGGLLKEVRHYAHEFIHEVMVDLMYMQRELHPSVLAVVDGTVMGDGAGPRTMVPRIGNLILASADQVAIDAIAAKIMGFDPLAIPYLRMCQERGLGVADPNRIEIVGDTDLASTSMGFKTSRSLVIWGDQLIRRGPLRPLKRLLLHSPLVAWAPFASNVYHDLLWYPTIGRARIRAFAGTPWGRLFETY